MQRDGSGRRKLLLLGGSVPAVSAPSLIQDAHASLHSPACSRVTAALIPSSVFVSPPVKHVVLEEKRWTPVFRGSSSSSHVGKKMMLHS